MAGPTVLTLEHPAEDAVCAKADHEGKDKESRDLEQHHADALISAGEAAHKRERDEAEHIVNERSGQDRVANLGFELFHLLERFDRDAHGGRRQDGADEDIFDHAAALNEPRLCSAPGKARAHDKRRGHAEQGDHEARLAAVFKLLDVRAHTGGEHQHDDAKLAELRGELCLRQQAETRGAEDETGEQRAHDLRHLELLRGKAQKLRAQQDQRKIQQIMIRHCIPSTNSLIAFLTHFARLYSNAFFVFFNR